MSFQSLKNSGFCYDGLFLYFPVFSAVEIVYTYPLHIGLLKEHLTSLRYLSSEIFLSSSPGVPKSPSLGLVSSHCCALDCCCWQNHCFQDFLVTFTKLPSLLPTRFSPSIKSFLYIYFFSSGRIAHTVWFLSFF